MSVRSSKTAAPQPAVTPAPYPEDAAQGAIVTNSNAYLHHMGRARGHHTAADRIAADIAAKTETINKMSREVERLKLTHSQEQHHEGQEKNAADVYAFLLAQLRAPLPALPVEQPPGEPVWTGNGAPAQPVNPLEAEAQRAVWNGQDPQPTGAWAEPLDAETAARIDRLAALKAEDPRPDPAL